MPRIKINSALALLLLVIVIPGLWIAQGLGKLNMPGEVSGALIAAFTLIVQYYFRKAPTPDSSSQSTSTTTTTTTPPATPPAGP